MPDQYTPLGVAARGGDLGASPWQVEIVGVEGEDLAGPGGGLVQHPPPGLYSQENPDTSSRVVNQVDTQAARSKAEALRDQRGKWAWQDPGRAARLQRIYSDTARRARQAAIRDAAAPARRGRRA